MPNDILLHARVRDASSALGRHHCLRAGVAVERRSSWWSLRAFQIRANVTNEAFGSISHLPSEVLLQAACFRHRCTRCRPVRPPRRGFAAPARARAAESGSTGMPTGQLLILQLVSLTIHDASLRLCVLGKMENAGRVSLTPIFRKRGRIDYTR